MACKCYSASCKAMLGLVKGMGYLNHILDMESNDLDWHAIVLKEISCAIFAFLGGILTIVSLRW